MVKLKPKRMRKKLKHLRLKHRLCSGQEVFRCDPALNANCKKTACKYNKSIPPEDRICELTLNPDYRLRHGQKAKMFRKEVYE